MRRVTETEEIVLVGIVDQETLEAVKADTITWEVFNCQALDV